MVFSTETEDNLGVIFRKEYRDLSDSTVKDFERYTGHEVNSEGESKINTNGKPSTILFRHIESLHNIQNLNLGFFILIQADELESADQFWLLTGRLRRQGSRRSGWLSANANGHNWIWEQWLKKKNMQGDFPAWEATTFDNADVLPKDYIDSLKNAPAHIYKRLVMNDHSVAEGLVWPEFDYNIHTCDSFEFPVEWKWGIGLDHGHLHPTVALFGAIDYDGRHIIYNEHYEAGQLINYHATKIKAMEPEYERLDRIIDPTCRFRTLQDRARSYSVQQAYAEEGVSFRTSPSEAAAGINMVGELFKRKQIIIFRDKCPNLVKEIQSWKWKRQRAGDEKQVNEEAVRINDDAAKALIYLISGRADPTAQPKKVPQHLTEEVYMRDTEPEESYARLS